MTPERFRQIEELYHAARSGSADQRVALLAQADPDVRRQVESLLAGSAGQFLDRPAIQNAPPLEEDATVVQLSAGACLGPYRIESKLGEGGMGEVFRAIDTRLGRAVAIKTTREQFSARFEREARAISSLNHPHICTLHDVGPDYLVMELVEGETIAARLKRGPLPLKTALLYASQIASALAEAHAKGIVHRDLKPGNIMLAKSGVKVLDFGLAKSGQDETVTASHMIMGTPAYMAPEQRTGKQADERSDIYSFGCVLYEMLTGARIGSQRKRIPSRKLEKIVNRCLEEDPARRWQSVADLQKELDSVTVATGHWKIAAAAALVLALAAAAYFYLHRPRALKEQDTVVLADFVNNTGDPIFDSTLRQGLAIQLEQSPFLKILDDDRVQRDLRLMNLQAGARITDQGAHDVCVREGAATTIDGAIASLGKNYVITLQAVSCQNGGTLARQQVQAENKERVLNALSAAATGIRAKLGESLNSIQKVNRPLEQATTASLEALQSYTAALGVMGQGHFLASVPLFERAISIDPNFAMAYYTLGVAYEQAGETARSVEYAKKALSLSNRVSEMERTEITAYYYRATGELDKEIDAYQQAARTIAYRNWSFHNQLAVVYIDLGRYEDGLQEGLEAARLNPDLEAPYRRQLDAYICLDRLPEARQVAEKVRALHVDGPRIHQRFLEIAYVAEDPVAAAKEIQWFSGKPEEYLSIGLQAANRNVHGERLESHKLYQRAAETARLKGFPDTATEFDEADAQADALSGNCRTALRMGRPALTLALCGDAAQAEKLAAQSAKLSPNGTIWNAVQLPEIRAALALQRNQPAESVELLAPASPYERSYIETIYLRGLAYLRLHKAAEAAAEFRKIVDHKGASWAATWIHPNWGLYYSPSHLALARAYSQAGDTPNAKKAFQAFFDLYKTADPDTPILRQAKTEYLNLR
jgi:eukaryotic-like serine/threonine-protein kinase